MATHLSVKSFGSDNDYYPTFAKSQEIITLEFTTNTSIKLLNVTFTAGDVDITNPYSVSYKYESNTYDYVSITDLSSLDYKKTTWRASYTVNTADFTGANSEFNYKINYRTYSGDGVVPGSLAESIVFDNGSLPGVTVTSLTDAFDGTGVVKLGDTIKLTFNTSELLQTPPTVKFKVGNDPNNATDLGDADAVNVVDGSSGLTYTATYEITYASPKLTGLVYFEISNIIDKTGNASVPDQIGNGLLTLSMDNKNPTLQTIKWYKNNLTTEITSGERFKRDDTIRIELTYSETVTSTLSKVLTLKKIDGTTLGGDALHSGGVSPGTDIVYIYPVSENYNGILTLDGIDSLEVKDIALNPAAASNITMSSQSIIIDVLTPSVISPIVSYGPTRVKNGATISLIFSSDEEITPLSSEVNFKINSTEYPGIYNSTGANSALNNWAFDFQVPTGISLDAETPIEYQITKIVDLVGNETTSTTWTPGITLDNKAPTLQTIKWYKNNLTTEITSGERFKKDDEIYIKLEYSEPITITGPNQSNVLTLTHKDTGAFNTTAVYISADEKTITYKYTADTNHSLGVITLTGINQLGSTDIVGNSVTVVADNSAHLLSPPIIIDIDPPVISNIVYKALGPHESRVKSEGKISLRFTVNEELGPPPVVKFQIDNTTTVTEQTPATPILIDPSTNCWETIYTVLNITTAVIKYKISEIEDLAGNKTTSSVWSDDIITVDNEAPTIITGPLFYTSRGPTSKTVKPSEDIILTFTTNEEIQTPTVTFDTVTTTLTSVSVINTLNADKKTWQAKYTVSSNSPNGTVNYTINYKDLAGNDSNMSGNTMDQITIDTFPPTVTVDHLKNASTFSYDWVTNDESVELQFTNTDISTTVLPMVTFTTDPSKSPIVTIATVQCEPGTNNNNKYTATFKVNAGGTDGKIFYKIHNIYDGAGNKGADVNGSNTLTIDTTKPIIENVSLVGSVVTNRVKESDTIMLSFTTTEEIVNPQIHFKLDGISWVPANIINAGPIIWNAEYILEPGTNINNQLVQYDISGYTDLAGNPGDQLIGSSSLIADTGAPTIIEEVCISSGANANWMKIGEEVQLTFTTDEKIQTPTVTFKAGSTDFTNVTVTNSNGDQKTWKAVALAIQSDWSSSTGTHQIYYTINEITDLAGNTFMPPPSVNANISFNPSPPSHMDVKWYKNDLSTEITTGTSLKKNDKIRIELIYSDNVTADLTKSLILKKYDETTTLGTTTLGSATRHSGGVGTGTDIVYTYTVSESYDGVIILNGIDHLDVKDLALNPAKASNYMTPSLSITIDVDAPTVTHIDSYRGPGSKNERVKNDDIVTLIFTTNEQIKPLSLSSEVNFKINSTEYPGTYNSAGADSELNNWAFDFQVPTGISLGVETPIEYQITKIVDNVGNETTSSIWTPGIILDNKAPNISGGNAGIIFTTTNSNNSYAKKGDTIDMTFTADEEISVPKVNFKIGEDNTGVGSTGTPLGNNKWRISYTLPTTSPVSFTGLINYTFTKFEDLVGNDALSTNVDVSGTSNITYIRDIPTVTVTTDSFTGSIKDSWVKVGEQIQLSFKTSNELKSNPSVTFVTATATDPVIQGVVTHVVGTDKYDVIGVIDADSPNGQISYKITDIYDKAGNAGNDASGGTSSNLKVDTVAPSITNTDNSKLPEYGISGELIDFTFTADEQLGKNPTVTFKVGPSFDHSSSVQILQTIPDAALTSYVPNSGWVYTVYEIVAPTFANGILSYKISDIEDNAGNKGNDKIVLTNLEIDTDSPIIDPTSIVLKGDRLNNRVKASDKIMLSFTVDEKINAPPIKFKIGGTDWVEVDATKTTHVGQTQWSTEYTVPTPAAAAAADNQLVQYKISGYTDLAGNLGVDLSGSSSLIADTKAPVITADAANFKSSGADPDYAKVGDEITLEFTTNEETQTPIVTFNITDSPSNFSNVLVTNPTADQKTWKATYSVITGADNGPVEYSVSVDDLAGNNNTQNGTAGVTIDTLLPEVSFVSLMDTSDNSNIWLKNDSIIRLVFSSNDISGATLFPKVTFFVGDTLATATKLAEVQSVLLSTGSPRQYIADLLINNTTDNGLIFYKIHEIYDIAGNKGDDLSNSDTLKLDTTIPSILESSIVLKGDRLNNRVKASDKIMLSFTVDEKINAPTIKFKIGGTDWIPSTPTHVGQTQWSAEYTVPTPTTAAAAADNQLVQYKISGYTDLAGNLGVELSGSSFLIADTKAPVITALPSNFKSSGVNSSYAKVGDEITLEFTTNEETQTPIVTFNITDSPSNFSNVLVTNPTADQKTWKATYSVITGTVNGMVGYSISVDDLAGNSATPSSSEGVTIDTLLPEVSFVSLMDTSLGANDWVKDSSTIRLVFSSNDISGATTLPKVTFFVGDTLATATKLAEVQSSLLQYTDSSGQYIADLIINNATDNGLIFYKIHAIYDIAGNKGNDLSNSDTLKLDTTIPSILESSITFAREGAGDPNWATKNNTIRLTFSSSEIITKPTVEFKYKNVPTSATVTPHAVDPTCWMATLVISDQFDADAYGKEKISYEISNITDRAGNVAPINHTGSKELKLDTTAPTITDITWRKGANGADITTTKTYFTTNDEIYIEFTYDEIINITNGITSIVKLKDGDNKMSATFVKKDGDTKLIYKYTVLSTTTDASGAKVEDAPNGVTDLAGNEAATTTLTVSLSENDFITIDTTAPTIEISSPTAGDCISDIELIFTLNGIPVSTGFVTFERTGGTVDVTALHTRVLTTTEMVDVIGTSNVVKTLSLTNLPDLKDGGIYTITLNVTDLAGNSSSDSVYNVTYDSTPPEINAGTISFPGQSWVNASGGNISLTFDTTKATTLTDMGVTFGLGTTFSNTSIFSNISGAPIAGDYTKWTYTADITEAKISGATDLLTSDPDKLIAVKDIHYRISISGCEELIGATVTASSGVKLDPFSPTIEDVSFKSYGTGASSAVWAKAGEEIKLTFKTSEKIQSPTVTFNVSGSPLTGVSVENPNSDKLNWVAKYVIPSDSSANGKVGYKINYMDLAGNTAVNEVIANLTIDTQAPVISGIELKNGTDQNIYWVKKGEKIKLTFISDSNLKSNPIVTFKSGHSQFDNSAAVLMGQVATTKQDNGDNTYTYNTVDYIVSEADITDGLISYEISNIEDEAGNQTANINGSATLKLDTIIPVVNDISLVNNTNGSVKWIKNNESISLTFSENTNKPITVGSVSFRIGDSNSSWENAAALTGSITSPANLNDYSSSWTITYLINHTDVSTEKTIFYNIIGIEDEAGNPCATKNGSTTLQLDTKPPTIDSITWHAEENGIAASDNNILYFNEGKTIYIKTAYSEPIILPATHSAINLSGFDDSASHNATYLKQVGNTLIYKYTIQMGDTTINYLSITPTSTWYDNITDRSGNTPGTVQTEYLSSYVKVDTTTPAIAPHYSSAALVNNMYIKTNLIGWGLTETNIPLLSGTVVFNPTSDNTGSPPSQTCALTATELTNTVSITSLTNKPSLTSGVKYDIIFTFEDKAGNITIETVNNITYDDVPPALKMDTISFKNTSTGSVDWVKDGECIQLYFETTEHIADIPTVEFQFGAGSEWGAPTGTSVSVPPTGSDNNTKWTSTYDISANDVSGAILYKISNISDRAGNMMTDYKATGNLLKLDRTVPEIVSIDQFESSNSLSTKAKKGDTITLKFTTSEPVVNPPIVTFGGKTTNVSSNDTSLLSWTATRTVDDTDTDGAAVIVKVILTDRAGNETIINSQSTDGDVTIDRTPPQILTTSGLPTFTSDNNSQSTRAKLNDTITLTFIADQEIQSPVVTFGGKATIVSSTTNTNEYTAKRIVDSNDTNGIPIIAITMKDIVGNETIITSQSTVADVTIDTISPILTIQTYNISGDNSLARRATKNDTIILEFTTNEEIQKPLVKFGTIDISANDVTQNPAGSITKTSWKATLTISDSHPDGIITPTITYCDLVGNMGQSYSAPTDITIDKVLPQLIGLPIFKNKTTNSFEWIKKNEVIQFTFTTDKTIQQPTVIFDMSGTERAATTTNTTGNIWISEYTTTDLDPEGVVTYKAVTCEDLAGNQYTIPARPTGATPQLVFDKTAPTISGITLGGKGSNSYINNIDIGYTLGETNTISSGSIIFNEINGGSITRTLTGGELSTKSSAPLYEPITLNSGSMYNIVFTFTDIAGNSTSETVSNVTYDTAAPQINENSVIFHNSSASPPDINWITATEKVTLTFDTNKEIVAPIIVFKSGGANFTESVNLKTFTALEPSGSNNNTRWTVEYSILPGDQEGTIFYKIDYTDLAGNASNSYSPSSIFKLDTTNPTLTLNNFYSNNTTSTTIAAEGDTIILEFTTDEQIKKPVITFGSLNATVTQNTLGALNASWIASYTIVHNTANMTIGVGNIGIIYNDLAGNTGANSVTTAITNTVEIDTVKPKITSAGFGTAYAKEGETITLTFEANDEIPKPSVTFGNKATLVTDISTAGTNGIKWTATYNVNLTDALTNDKLGYTITFYDKIGNKGVDITPSAAAQDVTLYSIPIITSSSLVSDNIYSTQYAVYDNKLNLTVVFNNKLRIGTKPKAKLKIGTHDIMDEEMTSFGTSGTTWTHQYHVSNNISALMNTNVELPITYTISNVKDLSDSVATLTDVIGGVTFDTKPPTMGITFGASVKTSSSTNTTSDRNIKLVFTSSEDTSNFTIDDIDIIISGGAGIAGVLSNFNGSGKIYTADFAPSYDKTYTVSVPSGVFTDGVGNPINTMATFTFTYDGIAENIKLAKKVANWHYYNLHDEYLPGVPAEAPVETATATFRKSLVPAAKIEYDKIMMKAFHKTMNTP